MKVLKSETFLRHLVLTLLVAMLAAAHTVQAQDSYPDYISEVMVVGYGSEKTVSELESLFPGWKAVDYNLNKGAYGDDIYLIYKTASRNNTNGGYITDFIVSDVENPSDNLTYNGRTYHLCPYGGYQTFTAQKGDLNRGAQGKYVYLYYTRDNFSDNKRAVTGISFDATSSNAVQLQCTTCQSGTTTYKEADFNRGAQPGSSPHIYMHITTTPKSNRPSSDPKMASGLTYNGKSQALLSIENTNTGTMMYSVNDGSFSSTIPTATDAGDYTVQYYAASDDYGNKSETKSQTVSIAKATNNKVTVSIANSIDGIENVNPTVNNNLSTGTITYQYSTSPSSGFSTAKPNAPGTWYVKAIINADNNCEAYTTATKNFTLIDWEGDGTSSSPYLIKSTTDLDRLAQRVNAGNSYSDTYFRVEKNITYDNTKDNNFTAIGTSTNPFNGTFDGGNNNGYTISGIRINTNTKYQGLFGYVKSDATIQNVTLEDAEITCSNDYVGGIVGKNDGDISNCTSSAKVSTTGSNNWYYGGISGYNYGSISNCTSSATVSSSGNNCYYYGGIAGYNYGKISLCTSSATVSSSGTNKDYGGIVGHNDGTISNCTSSATVSSSGTNCEHYGGIIGYNIGAHTNNLAIDAVISSDDHYGAIAGYNAGPTYQTSYNFYNNCTVHGVNNATNVGCNGADIDDFNGAVSVHTITLCDGITITSDPSITYNETNYYAKGTVLKLQKNIATTYYANGEEISGETFTMPDKDVTFTRALVINGDNGANLIINENKDNQTIVFRRSFRKDITATVILPFGFKASDYFEGKGTFHTLDNVEYNEQAKQWEAKASQAISEIKANTPYIFKPTADLEEIIFTGVDVKANTGLSKEQAPIEISSETNSKDWTLVGVYTKKVWNKSTPTEYGFASVADGDIAAGEFVRAGAGAWVNPTRCYLKYSGTEESLISKSSVKLPEKIVLIFPDKNDIVMPVSEIIPNADVKVWSYEKTIFIQSKAGEKFKIVDMSGKTLKESVTQSDRDEITLNRNFSGIVIVRIGNRSFKIMY